MILAKRKYSEWTAIMKSYDTWPYMLLKNVISHNKCVVIIIIEHYDIFLSAYNDNYIWYYKHIYNTLFIIKRNQHLSCWFIGSSY